MVIIEGIQRKYTHEGGRERVPHTQPLLEELIPMKVKMPKSGRTKLEALYMHMVKIKFSIAAV